MHTPATTASTNVLRTFTVFTCARLKSRESTRALSGPLIDAFATVRSRSTARMSAEDATMEAQAARVATELDAKEVVVAASLAVLSTTKNKRNAIYKHFFPKGATGITRLPIEQLPKAMKTLEDVFAENPSSTLSMEHLPLLTTARVALEATIATCGAAASVEAVATKAEDEARAQWRVAYQKVYGELLALMPDNKARVESFFRKSTAPKSKKPAPTA